MPKTRNASMYGEMTLEEIHEVARAIRERGWKASATWLKEHMRVGRRSTHGGDVTGRYSVIGGLVLTVGPKADRAMICEILLHEMLHYEFADTAKTEGWHGERFRLALAGTARRLWGVVVDPHPRTKGSRWRGSNAIRAYVLDDNIQDALRAMWSEPQEKAS